MGLVCRQVVPLGYLAGVHSYCKVATTALKLILVKYKSFVTPIFNVIKLGFRFQFSIFITSKPIVGTKYCDALPLEKVDVLLGLEVSRAWC